ncbi:hypothetical protein EF294_00700 [Gordonia oryzae]|uniref:Uncharacterized protein n=1 Tax=Gordonia oryzae TaxID=2487349 RepID=A0A3N4GTK6_9ACTN|nr:hypothetical protein EF294_00700 [Gordonia oryzae]
MAPDTDDGLSVFDALTQDLDPTPPGWCAAIPAWRGPTRICGDRPAAMLPLLPGSSHSGRTAGASESAD